MFSLSKRKITVFTLTTHMTLVRYFSLSEENIFIHQSSQSRTLFGLVITQDNISDEWLILNPHQKSSAIAYVDSYADFFFVKYMPKQKGPSETLIIPQ